jgi:hypothetical protein
MKNRNLPDEVYVQKVKKTPVVETIQENEVVMAEEDV